MKPREVKSATQDLAVQTKGASQKTDVVRTGHNMPQVVYHPIQILAESYRGAKKRTEIA